MSFNFQFHMYLLLFPFCMLWIYFAFFFFRFLTWPLRLLIWDFLSCLNMCFSAMDFPLSTASSASINLGMLYFHFHSAKCIFYVPWDLLFDPWVTYKGFVSSPNVWRLLLSFCYWFLVWFYFGNRTHYMISNLLNLMRFVLWHSI